jgi:hypothetical protein
VSTVTRRRFTRGVAALTLTMTALMSFAPDASAVSPQRVGWWNTLSAGGAVAPAPTTPTGGIRVAAGPGQVLAYGAVLYSMPTDATGQLKLTIAGSQGTPQVQACPTKNTRWKAGDDQPSDSAPAYDCSITHYPGTISSDGASVSFDVTTFDAITAGQLSLAIVPDLSATGSPAGAVNQPFSVDIGKPGASSMTTTGAPPPSMRPSSGSTPAAQQPAPSPPSHAAAAGQPLGVPAGTNLPDTQAVPPTAPAPQVAPSAAPASAQSSPDSTRGPAATAGSVIGGLALVVALMFWGTGRGLLGGRIIPLSVPLAPRSDLSQLRGEGG